MRSRSSCALAGAAQNSAPATAMNRVRRLSVFRWYRCIRSTTRQPGLESRFRRKSYSPGALLRRDSFGRHRKTQRTLARSELADVRTQRAWLKGHSDNEDWTLEKFD